MRRVAIVTDSTCDLPIEMCAQYGITVVPLNVRFGEQVFRDAVELTPRQFFQMLEGNSELPKTSQPPVGEFEEAYRRLGADGLSVVSIHLSSKLSGTVHSAEMARDAVRNECAVEVIDSGSASWGLGMITLAAAEMANAGADQKEIAAHVRRLVPNIHILFFIDTLEYLQRGGRIGRARAFLGTLLNIRPILKLEDGEIHPVEKVRTRSKAADRLVEFVEMFPHIDRVAIVHDGTASEVETLRRRIEPLCPRERILVGEYGSVIATHAGPGGIGVIVSQGATS